ncbi:MAG: asparagine synthetase B family protein, partial [Terriglobia bacterium]
GSDRYTIAPKIWRILRLMPHRWRCRFARTIQPWIRLGGDAAGVFSGSVSGKARLGELRSKGERVAGLLAAKQLQDLYFAIFCHWQDPAKMVEDCAESRTILDGPAQFGGVRETAQRLMFFDTVFYLPDDILVKLDRASMAVSLESRVPLLDHRVVEFAARLPRSLKIRKGRTKWVLRKVLDKYVPSRLTERPKMGFSLPLGEWLRGPLRDWAEALLNETRLQNEGFFKPAPIRRLWLAHQAGKTGAQYQLWDVLMFQAWWEHWAKNRTD